MPDLKEVTDRFSLFHDGRTIGANGRNYMIDSVNRMLTSKAFLEGVRLGEHYGYYGHQVRIRSGLKVPESEVVILEGKPVNITNVPSNVTVSASVDEGGIVTHTQRILRSETGQAVTAMLESGHGGWSWAVGGVERGRDSIARVYHGMDWVYQPNYVSLDRQSAMLESAEAEQMLLESLSTVAGTGAADLLNYWRNHNIELAALRSEIDLLQQEAAMLENVSVQHIETKTQLRTVTEELEQVRSSQAQKESEREALLLEAIDSLPIILTAEQRSILKTTDNKDMLVALLEQIGKSKSDGLPIGNPQAKSGLASHRQNLPSGVSFSHPTMVFPK